MTDSATHPLNDGFVRLCGFAVGAGFVGFLIWAVFVPLDEGVSAQGTIVVESNRQVVQHLEGGIIAELNVSEGEQVAAGDPLVVLQDTASLAGRDQVIQTVAALRASELRLLAVQSGQQPDFSDVATLDIDSETRDSILERQTRLFDRQVTTHETDLALLVARRDGARSAATLTEQQIGAARDALEAARGQYETTQAMYRQQMARLDQVRSLEREIAALEGDIARLRVEQVDAQTRATDLEGQIAQAQASHNQAIAEELVDVRTRLLEAEEGLLAAQDRLDRSIIYAPADGEVLNLSFSTEGGVVRPGEPILEIVPNGSGLIASVRVRPVDRARVFEGQTVRSQIHAYRGWQTPRLRGEVISVSADLKVDPQDSQQFYEVRIRIPEDELARAEQIELRPGMPISTFIFSGSERTTMEYLFEPISESLFRGLRGS